MNTSWKTLAGLAVAIAAALALSTSALALGGGSSPASSQAQLKTVLGRVSWSGRRRALYPGAPADTELLHFAVINAGHAAQRLRSITVSISARPNGDAESVTEADIHGCRAVWFAPAIDRGNGRLPVRIASGASYPGVVDLTMRDSGGNQNACRGASPTVTITAGS